MIVYIDAEFKCHLTNDGTMRAVETVAFDGKCKKYIEGFRFVPFEETWIREDGQLFIGEMICSWRNHDLLMEFQSQYEEMQMEAEAAYSKGVNSI